MKLKQLLIDLRYGELSNSPFVHFNGDSYISKELPKIISAINAAITQLSIEFMLFKDECKIITNSYCTEYELSSTFALSNMNSNVPIDFRYIMDSPISPFVDNVIKISSVFDSSGRRILMQDLASVDGVYLSSPTTIILPNEPNKLFTVQYFAAPEKIPLNEKEDSSWELSIPLAFETVFKLYLLYKVYATLGTDKGNKVSNGYFQQYQYELKNLLTTNIAQNDYVSQSIKPLDGWV